MDKNLNKSDAPITDQATALPAGPGPDQVNVGASPPNVSNPDGAEEEPAVKFFALRKGRSNKGGCIYLDEQDLLQQVDGFEGADYMKCDTLDSAYRYLDNTDARTEAAGVDQSVAASPDFGAEWIRMLAAFRVVYPDGNTASASSTSVSIADTPLDKWIKAQQNAYTDSILKKGKKRKLEVSPLSEAQIGILKSVGLELKRPSVSSTKRRKASVMNDDTWNNMLQEITTFKGKTGHTVPPHGNPHLREWVQSVQAEYKKFTAGEESILTTERVQALNAIQFQFESMKRPWTPEWLANFHLLEKYKAQFGHCDVPKSFDEAPFERLGFWVKDQRKQYQKMIKNKTSSMNPFRAKKLSDLGITWAFTNPASKSPKKLSTKIPGTSANGQRSNIAVRASASLVVTDPCKGGHDDILADWNMMLAAFEAVYPKGNKSAGPSSSVSIADTPLDKWILAQKDAYSDFIVNKDNKKRKVADAGSLTAEQVDLLKGVGFELKAPAHIRRKKTKKSLIEDSTWDQMVQEIRLFKESVGHTIPPKDMPLREWVQKVQSEYKKFTADEPSILTPERVQTLKEIDFKFDGMAQPWTAAWKAKYEDLKKYKALHGHCDVPKSFSEPSMKGLGLWVKDQRKQYQRMLKGQSSSMNSLRAKKLSDLGITWAFSQIKV